jgi:hypothetical protein
MRKFLFSIYLALLFACTVTAGDSVQRKVFAEDDAMAFDEGLTNPGAPRAWSRFGTLYTPEPNGANPGLRRPEEVSMQALFTDDPGVYTLQFQVEANPTSVAFGITLPARALADVTWSVEGNSITRRIHVTDGCTIVGTGQGVRVVVRDDTELQAISSQVSYPYTVGMTLTKGNKSMTTPPLYILAQSQIVAAPTFWIVPSNIGANQFIVYPGWSGGAPATDFITLQGVDQFNAVIFAYRMYPSSIPQYLPLPPNVQRLRVLTAGTTVNLIGFAIFLGIDG